MPPLVYCRLIIWCYTLRETSCCMHGNVGWPHQSYRTERMKHRRSIWGWWWGRRTTCLGGEGERRGKWGKMRSGELRDLSILYIGGKVLHTPPGWKTGNKPDFHTCLLFLLFHAYFFFWEMGMEILKSLQVRCQWLKLVADGCAQILFFPDAQLLTVVCDKEKTIVFVANIQENEKLGNRTRVSPRPKKKVTQSRMGTGCPE